MRPAARRWQAARGALFPWVPVLRRHAASACGSRCRASRVRASMRCAALRAALGLALSRRDVAGPGAPAGDRGSPALLLGSLAAGRRGRIWSRRRCSTSATTARSRGGSSGSTARNPTTCASRWTGSCCDERCARPHTRAGSASRCTGTEHVAMPEPGSVLILTGHLAAPAGPVGARRLRLSPHGLLRRSSARSATPRTPVLLLARPEAGDARDQPPARAACRRRSWRACRGRRGPSPRGR